MRGPPADSVPLTPVPQGQMPVLCFLLASSLYLGTMSATSFVVTFLTHPHPCPEGAFLSASLIFVLVGFCLRRLYTEGQSSAPQNATVIGGRVASEILQLNVPWVGPNPRGPVSLIRREDEDAVRHTGTPT